jgi:hypothetical protein
MIAAALETPERFPPLRLAGIAQHDGVQHQQQGADHYHRIQGDVFIVHHTQRIGPGIRIVDAVGPQPRRLDQYQRAHGGHDQENFEQRMQHPVFLLGKDPFPPVNEVGNYGQEQRGKQADHQ